MQNEIRKQIFFVFTPPRSRSTWLANFLSWGPAMCHHEVLPEVPRVVELHKYFGASAFSFVGTVDNGAALFAPAILREFPDAKYVCITRDIAEVKDSLKDIGLEERAEYLDALNAGIELVQKTAKNILTVNYHTISRNLRNIWTHCIGPIPPEVDGDFNARVMQLERMHIELDMRRERARLEFLNPNVISLFENDMEHDYAKRIIVPHADKPAEPRH